MSDSLQYPTGMPDWLDEQLSQRLLIESYAREIFGNAGYRQIETPMMEYTDVFSRGVGASTDIVNKEMFTFSPPGRDGSVGRSLTLRPEGTAAIMRAYAQYGMHKQPGPVKLWYCSPFFRRERPQAGRFRQFWQVGAECIGASSVEADVESMVLLTALIARCGVNAQLRINTLGSLSGRAVYREALTEYLMDRRDQLSDDVIARIETNPLRAFDAADAQTQSVMTDAPRLLDVLPSDDIERYRQTLEQLDDAGVAYIEDPTLVRGLDYYTHTVYECNDDRLGAQSGVGGGGRYDALAETLGFNQTPAVGFGAGIERILLAGDVAPTQSSLDYWVIGVAGYERAGRQLTQRLREAGFAVGTDLLERSFKAQMKAAGRSGAASVVFVGEQLERKDLTTGEQTVVDEATLFVS